MRARRKIWPIGGRTALVLFVFVWLSGGYFGSWGFNPNNSTRIFAAISLVEEGDATIDQFRHMSMDHAAFGDHFYTDKAPGMTIMALPAVWIANKLTDDQSIYFPPSMADPGFDRFIYLRVWLASFMSSALLVAMGAVALFWLGISLTGSRGAALFGALGYAFANPIWGWATTIFGHAPVSALLIIGTAGLRYVAVSDDGGRNRYGAAVIAAFALAWSLVVEHQAAFAVLAILLYGLWATRQIDLGERLRLLAVGIVAGMIAFLPLLIYNLIAFDVIFRVGYEGVVGFDGMNEGVMGLTYPKLPVLWDISFGLRRGLIWCAPLLFVAPVGWYWLARRERERDVAWLAMAVTAIYFLLNAAYVYWDGGNSTGPRHAIPAAGFMAIGLIGAWAVGTAPIWRGILAAMFGVSAIIGLMIAAAEVTAYGGLENPMRDAVYQRFATGQIRTVANVWFGTSPFAAIAIYLVFAVVFAALIWLSLRHGAKAVGEQEATSKAI